MPSTPSAPGLTNANLNGAADEPLHENVYQEIRRNLIAGQFQPGEAVTLRGLAAKLGTSAMPVREALRRLVAERALDLGANRILYGYGALRDGQSLLHLRAHRLPIVVTPSLEEACGKLSSIARHPITKMQDAGLFMTLATGAPGLTGSDMTGELERMSKHLSWRLDAMRNVTGRSIEAAFIVPEGRFTIARAIENWRHRPMLTADNNDDGGYSM